jgi:hypothetical protein
VQPKRTVLEENLELQRKAAARRDVFEAEEEGFCARRQLDLRRHKQRWTCRRCAALGQRTIERTFSRRLIRNPGTDSARPVRQTDAPGDTARCRARPATTGGALTRVEPQRALAPEAFKSLPHLVHVVDDHCGGAPVSACALQPCPPERPPIVPGNVKRLRSDAASAVLATELTAEPTLEATPTAGAAAVAAASDTKRRWGTALRTTAPPSGRDAAADASMAAPRARAMEDSRTSGATRGAAEGQARMADARSIRGTRHATGGVAGSLVAWGMDRDSSVLVGIRCPLCGMVS